MITKSIIAAYNKNRVIGSGGRIPWEDKEDLERFKELTLGYPVVMGRKTHESIGRILKGRANIIITSQQDYVPVDVSEAVLVTPNLEIAIRAAETEALHAGVDEIFFIGGQQIYEQSLPLCDRMYLSEVRDTSGGDAFFPVFDEDDWEEDLLDYCEKHTFRSLVKRRMLIS